MIVDPTGYKFPDVPLNEMRDKAILLSMAHDYLCEEYFLKKAGIIIGNNAEALKDYIEHTKEQLVGKPVGEVELNKILESIIHIAGLLQKADEGAREECAEGKLGEDLCEKIRYLAQGINVLEQQVEGKVISVPAKREPFKLLVKPFKTILHIFIATSKAGLKLAATLVLIGLLLFSFLYFTMESEKGLVEKIERSQAKIQSAEATLSEKNKELQEIKAKIATIRDDEAHRKDEIELMDLNLKVYKLAEEQEKVRIEADMERESLEENLKHLENLRRKSFLEKLLRM